MNLSKRFSFARAKFEKVSREAIIFQYLLNWTIKVMAVIRSIDRARFQIVPTSVYILSISRCHFQFRFTPTAWSTLRSIHEEHC